MNDEGPCRRTRPRKRISSHATEGILLVNKRKWNTVTYGPRENLSENINPPKSSTDDDDGACLWFVSSFGSGSAAAIQTKTKLEGCNFKDIRTEKCLHKQNGKYELTSGGQELCEIDASLSAQKLLSFSKNGLPDHCSSTPLSKMPKNSMKSHDLLSCSHEDLFETSGDNLLAAVDLDGIVTEQRKSLSTEMLHVSKETNLTYSDQENPSGDQTRKSLKQECFNLSKDPNQANENSQTDRNVTNSIICENVWQQVHHSHENNVDIVNCSRSAKKSKIKVEAIDRSAEDASGIGKNDLNKLIEKDEKFLSQSEDKHCNMQSETDTDKQNINCKVLPNKDDNRQITSLKDRIRQQLYKNAHEIPKNDCFLHAVQERMIQSEQLPIVKESGLVWFELGPFYGLPSKVQQLLETQRGIKKLYGWQDECLTLPAVVEGKNLIYCLPTSSGKTLVAELLILKQLLIKKMDALLILPFVSIVHEKVKNLSQFAVEFDFLVEEYAGSKGRFPLIKRRKKNSLFVATIEKGHSLINCLIEQDRMDILGLVVIDELHMLGEGGSRGSFLEAALLKILHAGKSCQIIGMSATLSNIRDLQKFLQADIYSGDFRPVNLTEYIKLEDNIYSVNSKVLCPDDCLQYERTVLFQYTTEMTMQDPDHLLGLVTEVIPAHSCLVFCPTKKNCENVALMLCKMMSKYKKGLSKSKRNERKELLKELKSDSDGNICPVLNYTIYFGVAYHHGGLTVDERRLIEEAYAEGVLCLLACTSTLAAGVNLPAKRVVLRFPYVGNNFISRCQYKQMIGRAGRAGIDSSGESILIVRPSDKEKVKDLINGQLEDCHSSLSYNGGKGIRFLLLSLVGLKVVGNLHDAFSLMSKTLLAIQTSTLKCNVMELTREALQTLIQLGLVVQKRKTCSLDTANPSLEVTPLGRATFKGSIDIDNSTQLYDDLQKAEESLVLANFLHLLYLITPYGLVGCIKPSWMIYFQQLSSLNPAELKVADLVGIPESYVARKASGQMIRLTVDEFVVNRFYLTLMLYGIWKQKSLWEVSSEFQQPRGFIQTLVTSAASFATCVLHFCQELDELWCFQELLGNFVKRLSYCATVELIPLLEVPGVKMGRARQLFNAGYRTLSLVARADPEQLVKTIEHMPRKAARQIVASAQVLLNEKMEVLLDEVEELVSIPLSADKTPWML